MRVSLRYGRDHLAMYDALTTALHGLGAAGGSGFEGLIQNLMGMPAESLCRKVEAELQTPATAISIGV
jgi:hypothetical protein